MTDLQAVIWDTYGLDNPNSGIYTHASSLFEELAQINCHPMLFPTNPDPILDPLAEHPALLITERRVSNKINWCLQMGRELQAFLQIYEKQPWVYHGLSNINLPFRFRQKRQQHVRFVLTVHDLIPLLDHAHVSFAYQMQFRFLLPRALEVADAVICVSDWTRNCLLERYPWVELKTRVIPNGIKIASPHLSESLQIAQDRFSESLTTNRPALLCVSRYESYKRLPLLLEILEEAPFPMTIHVVTDPKGLAFFRKKGSKFLTNGSLKLYSNMSTEALDQLYAACDLVIHPSLYEGFCLPVMEALSHAKPVLYTQGSALDGGIARSELGQELPPSAKAKDWAEAIQESVTIANSQDFLKNLKNYLKTRPTWKHAALQLRELYNSL